MPKTNKRKCKSSVAIKKTKKFRGCRKTAMNGADYCSIHKPKFVVASEDHFLENEYGKCCFCNQQCNILSQSCGRCARIGSWYGTFFLNSVLKKTESVDRNQS